MVQAFHCELAWLGGEQAEADVLIEVEGDRTVRVTAGVNAPAGATRLAGLTLPGLANAHSHAFHRALRGRTHAGQGTFWTWREQMYRLAASLDPDTYHRLARAVFAEMVLAGITCVGEFHYLHHQPDATPYANPNETGEAMLDAAASAGLRITLLDTCYLHGGFGSAPNEVQRRFSDGSANAWEARVEALGALAERRSATARIGAAIHSVRAVDADSIEVVAGWAIGRDVPLHAHVSEQPDENYACIQSEGCTPIQLLARRGALDVKFTAVHATHVTEADIATLRNNGSTVCMCPTTERELADGTGPSAAFRNAAIPICLGSDSHAVIDLFEEARAIELDERLSSLQRGTHPPHALLDAATSAGHWSLGWDDAGALAVGRLADLVTVRLDSVRTAGTSPEHALATAVFAAGAADVEHVVIGGRVVVRGGRHLSIDVAAELQSSIRHAWEAAS